MSAHPPASHHADVCVVGAGPSGAVATLALARSGARVVCLEKGDWPDYSTARADKIDFEVAAGAQWSPIAALRQGVGDLPVDESESDITALTWSGVGGASVLYAAHWMRNAPSDFRVRSLDGVADDWPISYDDLLPYYLRAERDFGVAGLAGDPAFPGPWDYPMPQLPIGNAGSKVAQAHNALGWHWWPGANAIATRRYGNLNACRLRAACMQGCIDGAKSSADLTHWPPALAAGAQLVTRARVHHIDTNARGLATGVRYLDAAGREHVQTADVVILAGNGIGTPQLLLGSTDRNPEGLANSSGLVGRRLMMHPFTTATGVFDDELDTSYAGVWGQTLSSMEFYETDTSRGFVRGAKWNLMPVGGPLTATRNFPWGEFAAWGNDFHATIRERLGHSVTWGIIAEDLPDEDNRVVLSDTQRDGDGLPVARLIYRTSDNSRRLLDFHAARARESLEAAGARYTVTAPQIRETGWHILGTAKMGTDPGTAVVDADCRCHDVPNLYIVDGSVWPTSAGVNPTATIVALALRATERLVRQGALQQVPA
jgi:choline dehydrogenase-like flavoprotein